MKRQKCDRNPVCRTNVYIIGDKYYQMKGAEELVEHTCYIPPESQHPDTIYLGVWRNRLTGRLRYQGPGKKLSNALANPDPSRWLYPEETFDEPLPDRMARRVPMFELIEVKTAVPDWTTLDPSEYS